MLTFRCRDTGMKCSFEATAHNESELMAKIKEHAGKAHNMMSIPHDVMSKIRKAIKN